MSYLRAKTSPWSSRVDNSSIKLEISSTRSTRVRNRLLAQRSWENNSRSNMRTSSRHLSKSCSPRLATTPQLQPQWIMQQAQVEIAKASNSSQSFWGFAGVTLEKSLKSSVRSIKLTLKTRTSFAWNSYRRVSRWTIWELIMNERSKTWNSSLTKKPRLSNPMWNWTIAKQWQSSEKIWSARRKKWST